MKYKLYVGNLPFSTDEKQLTEEFTKAGTVSSVKIIRNSYNNRSKGFGFVEMETSNDANSAITMFNGKEMEGRVISVEKGKFQGRKQRMDKKRPMVIQHQQSA